MDPTFNQQCCKKWNHQMLATYLVWLFYVFFTWEHLKIHLKQINQVWWWLCGRRGVWDKTYYHMTSNTYVSLVKNSIYSIYGQKWRQTASALFCIKSFTFSKIFFFWIETSDLHIIIDVDNDNANDLRLEIANHLRLGSRLILIRFYILFRG